MSLDRLIRLAQKTGDRLIVHNATEDSDVVIMDLDSYERLLHIDDEEEVRVEDIPFDAPWDDPYRPLSESRRYGHPLYDERFGEDESGFDCEEMNEMEMDEEMDDDDEEDEWHSVRDVMGERYPFFDPELDDETPDTTDFSSSFDDGLPTVDGFHEEEVPAAPPQDIPRSAEAVSNEPTTQPIPQAEGHVSGLSWEEEPLADDPIFYEEPV